MRGEEALGCVGEHGLGLGDQLVELAAGADQRRGEVEHCVTAVVRPGDQPLLEQPAGEEPAQQPLALLGAEAAALLVADQLERPEVAGAAHVADDRHALLQLLEPLAQVALVLAHVLQDALALEDLDVAQRDRGGHRVAAERDAVKEHPALFVQRLGDPVADQHGAHRRVRGREALRACDHVGRRAVARRGEPLAEAPEPGDHLVGDERDAVAVGDRSQPGPVALRRQQRAARVLDRLGDDHRDCIRACLDDRALHLLEQLRAMGGRIVLQLVPVRVRVRDPDDRDRRRPERLLHRPHAVNDSAPSVTPW